MAWFMPKSCTGPTRDTKSEPNPAVSVMQAQKIGPASALDVNDGFVTFSPADTVAAPAPAVLAAGSLSALLEKSAVEVVGQPTQGQAPPGSVVIASAASPPLRTIVGEMLRESDNQTAEMLVKELDRRHGGPGSTVGGIAIVRTDLGAMGLPLTGLVTVDGSGNFSATFFLPTLTSGSITAQCADVWGLLSNTVIDSIV